MNTGLVINNFVEAVNLFKTINCEPNHLTELISFYDQIETECNCDKMSKINRCINYYLKLPDLLTPPEKQLILDKNNQKPVTFLYQKRVFYTLSK